MNGEASVELPALQREWCTLQNQFDSYEKHALMIKLVSLVSVGLAVLLVGISSWIFIITAIFWLQEAIWKTFQQRIYQRLLVVEKAISEGQHDKAMQFNSNWQDNRAGYSSLVAEYMGSARKPTVAFPYIVLLLCMLIF